MMNNELDAHRNPWVNGEVVSEPKAAIILEPKSAFTQTLLNRRAVKKYALEVSKAKRAGKFKRVSETFFIGVEAEVDSRLRAIGIEVGGQTPVAGLRFTNGTTRRKLVEKLEMCVAQVVHGKVTRHPSVGVTLKD